ncbi:MAG: A24 family peptidase [Haliangiales bacterium]
MSSPELLPAALVASPGAYGFALLLGLLFGSFANVCIYRWPPTDEHPRGRSVVWPGSACPACGVAIRWYDNLPIVGFALLRGRCRACGVAIAPRYVLVEAGLGMLFFASYHYVVGLVYAHEPISVQLLCFASLAGFQWVLMVIAFIDLDHQLILDKITYPAVPIFYGLGVWALGMEWSRGLIGAALGYGLVRLIADGYRLLTGRDGMGYGDAKLLALIGAFLGWQAVIAALFLGSIVGSVIGVAMLAVARGQRSPKGPDDGSDGPAAGSSAEPEDEVESWRHVALPFGPFLVAGAIVFLYAQSWLGVELALAWPRLLVN